MMKMFWCTALLAAAVAAEPVDEALRAAAAEARAGKGAVAAQKFETVYRNQAAPAHQRLAALCGLLRTDAARLDAWAREGLASTDATTRGTVAQALALLPPERLATMRASWVATLPPESLKQVLVALVHVKSAAAPAFLAEALAYATDPHVREAALFGVGAVGTVDDVEMLLGWMRQRDTALAEAARRALIQLGDKRVDAVLASRVGAFAGDAFFAVKLLDVMAQRNALGHASAVVPFLAHADGAVRCAAFRNLGQQGGYAEQAAVLAAALKAKDEKERREARKAVMRIARRAGGVQFKTNRIGNSRTEACGVADFNNDGKLDIIAGPNLYLAPDFKALQVRKVKTDVNEQGKGYAHDFMNLPLDVDGDGKIDVVCGDWFSQETWWCRNTLPAGGVWADRVIEKPGNIETGTLVDFDGDGKATDVLPDTHVVRLYRLGQGGTLGGHFAATAISNSRDGLGRGCGDVNGDGLNDILAPAAWYEQTKDGTWKRHPWAVKEIGHTSNLIVYDVNKDGLNDILVNDAHKWGIFWYEQLKARDAKGEIQFKRHVIDNTWTQAHYLAWADIDGDGVPEIVTGKRFMAHNGGDPDEYGRLCVFYYDFTPGPNPEFRKYVISFDDDVGAGMNIVCADMDGDGDVDLVTTGKWGGPVIFENLTK